MAEAGKVIGGPKIDFRLFVPIRRGRMEMYRPSGDHCVKALICGGFGSVPDFREKALDNLDQGQAFIQIPSGFARERRAQGAFETTEQAVAFAIHHRGWLRSRRHRRGWQNR